MARLRSPQTDGWRRPWQVEPCIKIGRAWSDGLGEWAPVSLTRSLGVCRRVGCVDADGATCQGARATRAIARTGALQLVHDPPDRARTLPTLCTATKTIIDLAGHARPVRAQYRPNLMVRQDVAGTDDHSARLPSGIDGGTTTACSLR